MCCFIVAVKLMAALEISFVFSLCSRFYLNYFVTALLDLILDHLCVLSFHGTPHLQNQIFPIKTVFALTCCCLPLAMF